MSYHERFPKNEVQQAELEVLLTTYGIDFSSWGTGYSKTLQHLLDEINNGESELIEESGSLIRRIRALDITVTHTTSDGRSLILVEDRQEFTDGRVRHRAKGGVREKLSRDEFADSRSVARALNEELGVTLDLPNDLTPRVEVKDRDASSYPGLTGRYMIYFFEVNLPGDCFNPDGYIEHQPDRSTYFVWQQA